MDANRFNSNGKAYRVIPLVETAARGTPDELLDLSINTTMSRTAITSMTTFLSLLALVVFGGKAIEDFAVVMLVGIVICTYSAIFVSSPSLIYLGLRQSAAEAKTSPAPARP